MRPILSFLLACLLVLGPATVPGPALSQVIPGLPGGGSAPEAPADVADPVDLLLQILKDDAARAELVSKLEAQGGAPLAEVPAAPAQPKALGERIADLSTDLADEALDAGRNVKGAFAQVPRVFTEIGRVDYGALLLAFRPLLLVIAVTIAAFVSLRTLGVPFFRRVGKRAAQRSFRYRAAMFVGVEVLDFAIVAVTWAVGYFAALLVFGEQGQVGFRQLLYLNAFFAVEVVKVILRLVFSPSTGALRPIRIADWAARRLYRVSGNVVSILGYGYLLVLPVVFEDMGFAQSRIALTVIWLLAITYLAVVTLRYRAGVGGWFLKQMVSDPAPADGDAESGKGEPSARHRLIASITDNWFWLALAWLFWSSLTVLTGSPREIRALLDVSAQVALAILAGLAISGLMGRVVQNGIALPQAVNDRVPLLEVRLNRYVPRTLAVLRLIILLVVVIFAFSTLDVVSTRGLLTNRVAVGFASVGVSVGLILLAAFVVWLALTSWVDYRLNPSYGSVPTAREKTLLTLMRNAATIAIAVLAMMFALSEIGINIGPLIASAGVVGLAIGFGAQKLVQDIITGIFIQFENALNVGDVVQAGGITGAVERMTVRSLSIRDVGGGYHLIPFSSVDTVSNLTRDFSYYVIDMGVAYSEDVAEVRQAMHDAFDELRTIPEHAAFILGDLEWLGLQAFGDHAVMLRCRIKTWPAKQWVVGRAYNEIVKRIFDEREIEFPFPQQTVWFGENKHGYAPPVRVLNTSPDGEGGGQPGEGERS